MLQQMCDSIALLEEARKWREGRPMPSVTLTFPTKADAEVFVMQLRHEVGLIDGAFRPLDIDTSVFYVRGVDMRIRWQQPKQEDKKNAPTRTTFKV